MALKPHKNRREANAKQVFLVTLVHFSKILAWPRL